MMSVDPFKVSSLALPSFSILAERLQIRVPESELELIRRKLELARIDDRLDHARWTEVNGVNNAFMRDIINFWRTKYDWRLEETKLNSLPQFTTLVDVKDFGQLTMHFVHSKSSKPNTIPMLFIHGWPGSFAEVQKILPNMNEAAFDVVAPSLPGFGFSSYPDKPGFGKEQYAEALHNVMQKLGYTTYVVQGGDWGSFVGRNVAFLYPDHVQALHVNMVEHSPIH